MNFIQRMFSSIRDVIKGIFGKNIELDQLFSEINRGRYARRKAKISTDTLYAETQFSKEMQDIKAKAIANGTFMKAPNGRPTNLNERQWLQVRTKNFINWFGDWINDPSNASKVVDENGEPLVVYHNSKKDFNTFKPNSDNYIYFTSDAEYAKDLKGGKQYEVFINLKNPLDITGDANILWEEMNTIITEADYLRFRRSAYNYHFTDLSLQHTSMKILRNSGLLNDKDGIIGYDASGLNEKGEWLYSEGTEYVVFNPNQIKSATSNTGEFSTTNDDIRYRRADSERIRQHHRNKLQYGNLSQEQKDYIKLRNISIEDYNDMSDIEKEVLFHCMV